MQQNNDKITHNQTSYLSQTICARALCLQSSGYYSKGHRDLNVIISLCLCGDLWECNMNHTRQLLMCEHIQNSPCLVSMWDIVSVGFFLFFCFFFKSENTSGRILWCNELSNANHWSEVIGRSIGATRVRRNTQGCAARLVICTPHAEFSVVISVLMVLQTSLSAEPWLH